MISNRFNRMAEYDSELGCFISDVNPMMHCKGGGGSSSTGPSPEQRAIYQKQLDLANSMEMLGPQQFYGGQTLADQSQWTEAGQQAQLGAAGNMGALSETGMARFQDAMAYDPTNDPRAQEYVNNMVGGLQQNFAENVIPKLNSNAVQAGAFGGDRANVMKGQAARDLAGQMGDTATKAWMGLINSNRQNQAQMMGQLGNLQKSALAGSQAMLDVGQQQETREQAEIDSDRERFEFGQESPRQHYRDVVSMLSGIDFGGITKTSGGK